jgi:hypothetical protein
MKVSSEHFRIHIFSQVVEHDRQRLLAVERLLLETICFNFTSRMPFPYVIKIGRAFHGECLTATSHLPGDSSHTSDEKVDKTFLAIGYRLVHLSYTVCLSL